MTAKVLSAYDLGEQVRELYVNGLPAGDRTGWPSVDKHYSVAEGQLTVITGWPGSGKSEWLDALLVNLMHQGWHFAIFSPENQPQEIHVSKIMEKLVGLPFGAGPSQRMTMEDMLACMEATNGRFGFIASDTGTPISAQTVIETAEPWLAKHADAKRGLIIDPWNELEHWRPKNLSETEYVSQSLSYVRSWARKNGVHVWIVAHPQKMRVDGKLPIPRPDMISGSQNWWNKADNAITVWRNLEDVHDQEIEIHIQKIRFKHIGFPGVVKLRYDRVTGKYHELPNLRAYRQSDS